MESPHAHAVWKDREGGTGPSVAAEAHVLVRVSKEIKSAFAPSPISTPDMHKNEEWGCCYVRVHV